MLGDSHAPARPNPTANPVPVARTCVGNTCAKIPYRPTTPALVKKPAIAQVSDSCARLAWPRPNTANMRVDTTKASMVRPLRPKRSDAKPRTAPPVAPPTFAHTRTPPADDGVKPMSTTIFGTHL